MEIRVTKNDISKGTKSNASQCPVARAVRRATGVRKIGVDGWNISVGERDFVSPREVSIFVEKFDMGGRRGLKPFSFTLPGLKKLTNRTATKRETRVLVAAKRTK